MCNNACSFSFDVETSRPSSGHLLYCITCECAQMKMGFWQPVPVSCCEVDCEAD